MIFFNIITESKPLNFNLLLVIGVAPLAHEPNILEYGKKIFTTPQLSMRI